jgi:hypothetical protein
MTAQNLNPNSSPEVCARIKHLGYATSKQVRLYGEEYEIVSDPFPEAAGIAVHAKSKKNPAVRIVQLPATVLQSVLGRPA